MVKHGALWSLSKDFQRSTPRELKILYYVNRQDLLGSIGFDLHIQGGGKRAKREQENRVSGSAAVQGTKAKGESCACHTWSLCTAEGCRESRPSLTDLPRDQGHQRI